jgi:polygalacturonase
MKLRLWQLPAVAALALAMACGRRQGNAFLSGPLVIGQREVLVVAGGVTVYASLNPADYQIPGQYPANTCGTVSADGGGCYPFITFGGPDSGLEGTRGADGSLGVIDGRGNGTLTGTTQTWWDVAAAAASGGNQNNPVLVQGSGMDNITAYQIELENSPMYHIEVCGGYGLTVWAWRSTPPPPRVIPTASTRKARATSRLFENSTLSGYDSFRNLSASDTGIQIKTDANSGGVTERVTYRDICMTSIKHLLIFNPHYSSGGTSAPTQKDIVLDGVVSTDSVSGAYSILEGFGTANALQIDLENISLDNVTQPPGR